MKRGLAKLFLFFVIVELIICSAQAFSVTQVALGGDPLSDGMTNIGRAPNTIYIYFDQSGFGSPGPGFSNVELQGAVKGTEYTVRTNYLPGVSTIYIDIPDPLKFDTTYTINIPAAALHYIDGNTGQWVDSEPFTLRFTTIPRSLRVVSISPEDGASNIDRTSGISLAFAELIRYGRPNWNNIRLTTGNGQSIPISVSRCGIFQETLCIQPTILDFGTTYSLTIPMDAVESLDYNRLPADFVSSFTTGESPYHYILASAGTGGLISPNGDVRVPDGQDQAFLITPNQGFTIQDVLVDGASQGAISSYTFTNVIADHTIDVSFVPEPQFSITASAGVGGIISPNGEVAVSKGNDQTFLVTPNQGYNIQDVLVDGESKGAISSYTFTNVIADHTIDVSFIENQLADISLASIYERDLSKYSFNCQANLNVPPPTDKKTVYGGDKVVLNLTVKNNGPNDASGVNVNEILPKELEFINSKTKFGNYDKNSGDWTIGSLKNGETAILTINVKATKDQGIEIPANLKAIQDATDPNPSNDQAIVKFTVKPPVVFVHGWRGSPATWNDFKKEFCTAGIKYYIYDYSPGLSDPAAQSFHFEYWIDNTIRTNDHYQGRFTVVAHSMGALVSRFYIEANSKNANSVDKWIGIAPVNHGAAIADLQQLFPKQGIIRTILVKIFPDLKDINGAIVHMQTNDPETLRIEQNSNGRNAGIKYIVIMGRLGNDPTITPINVASWNKDIIKYLTSLTSGIKGQTLVKVSDKNYGLTWYGDGVVANEQSELDCAEKNIPILGQDHNSITHKSTVIDIVKNRVQNN